MTSLLVMLLSNTVTHRLPDSCVLLKIELKKKQVVLEIIKLNLMTQHTIKNTTVVVSFIKIKKKA